MICVPIVGASMPKALEQIPQAEKVADILELRLDLIDRSIAPLGGQRAWHARPDGGEQLEPIAPQPPEWPVLIKLKGAMDPAGKLNPNRFLPVQDATA